MKVLLVFLTLLSVACHAQVAPGNTRVDYPKETTRLPYGEYIDSLLLDTSLTMPSLYAWTLDSLVPPDSLLPNVDQLTVDYIKEVVSVVPYLDDWLIIVTFSPLFMGKSGVQLFWVTADYQVKDSAWLPGNRYHPGRISVLRWDQDSLDDIQYWVEWPVSTAAYIVTEEQIFQFRSGEGLVQIFAVEREMRQGEVAGIKATLETTHYEWETADELQVITQRYTFPMGNFDWSGTIEGLQWQSDTTYFLTRNPETLIFEQ